MSKKTELQADLQRIGYLLGRSHGTQESRSQTFRTFAGVMRETGFGIHSAAQMGGKHLQAYVGHRSENGIASRTLAKEMGHLRAVLRHIGKQGLADNPAYSNRSLGIAQGSRKGTKVPLSDAEIRAFQERAERLGRPDMGAILELQRALGLREIEAVRAGQGDTLHRLHRELIERGSASIIDGTKGGRVREVHPADVGRALAAVQRALEILETSGRRYLVACAKGVETTGLEQAVNAYSKFCERAKVQSHAARYAFAEERMQAYRNQGYSQREALIRTSLDLGHGDGRGRYVASVYVCNG
ncbi:integrase domain-containing protein [Steroidobacter agaridevorans]|uniref:integrase domain-containing protein n=1 Tax=Steroidobacter agaridevorans TaxID=2695856 RepID=UPI001322E427|nr:integrase domain-containing protein [Steroidobacter agaridevorans]GFE87971.1 DNA-binding protein [Steroidobacter agaridevorans]